MLPSQHHLHHPRARAKAQRRLRGMALFSAGALGVLGMLLMLYRHAAGLPALSIKDMPELHQDDGSGPTSYGVPQPTFRPGTLWLDDNDKPIQAHGGGILFHKGVYYWYGEDKSQATFSIPSESGRYTTQRVDVVGVRCYSSVDLEHWKDEGLVLKAGQHPDLDPSGVLERPKVLFNQRTGRFVMWMHVDDARYSWARAGVAWSNSPTGPFRYVGSSRPNGEMARDMNLFQDDDGTAYLLAASENNQVLHIVELTQDYLKPTPRFTRALVGLAREAPAAFKHQGRYYLLTSACTGWAPNRAEVFVADAMTGPWVSLGDPCSDPNPDVCRAFYGTQDTYVLPVPGHEGQGHFIMMADRWNTQDLGSSRYVWLPMWVGVPPSEQGSLGGSGPTSVVVRWYQQWDFTVFDLPQPS